MNPVVERANVVSVSLTTRIWVNFPDVCSLPGWRGVMIVRSKNLSKRINKFVYRISYIVYREQENSG